MSLPLALPEPVTVVLPKLIVPAPVFVTSMPLPVEFWMLVAVPKSLTVRLPETDSAERPA